MIGVSEPDWSVARRGLGRAMTSLRLLLTGLVLAIMVGAGPGCGGVSAKTPLHRELEASLLAQMSVLASDEFAGREPGTEGEGKTLRFIAKQWFAMGLQSGTNDPGHAWFAPVTVVAREPAVSTAQFVSRKLGSGRMITLSDAEALVLTSGRRSLIEGAPLLFVGRAGVIPPRIELAGRVAVLLEPTITVMTRRSPRWAVATRQ